MDVSYVEGNWKTEHTKLTMEKTCLSGKSKTTYVRNEILKAMQKNQVTKTKKNPEN